MKLNANQVRNMMAKFVTVINRSSFSSNVKVAVEIFLVLLSDYMFDYFQMQEFAFVSQRPDSLSHTLTICSNVLFFSLVSLMFLATSMAMEGHSLFYCLKLRRDRSHQIENYLEHKWCPFQDLMSMPQQFEGTILSL